MRIKVLAFDSQEQYHPGLKHALRQLCAVPEAIVCTYAYLAAFQRNLPYGPWNNVMVNFDSEPFLGITHKKLKQFVKSVRKYVPHLEKLHGFTVNPRLHTLLEEHKIIPFDGRYRSLEMLPENKDRALARPKCTVSLDTIRTIVCEHYELSYDEVVLKTNKRRIVLPRQIIMFLAKKYTPLRLKTISQKLGRKDHSTVIHACKTIKNQIQTDDFIAETVVFLRDKIDKTSPAY